MPWRRPAAWFPDGEPSRNDVLVGALVVAMLALEFASGESIVWPWAMAGFVAFALAMGPVAASPVGQRVGAWFRSIGVAGRVAVILVFVGAVVVARTVLELPIDAASSFAVGGLVAVAAFVAVKTAVWLVRRRR